MPNAHTGECVGYVLTSEAGNLQIVFEYFLGANLKLVVRKKTVLQLNFGECVKTLLKS